jgi:hypothetical protein
LRILNSRVRRSMLTLRIDDGQVLRTVFSSSGISGRACVQEQVFSRLVPLNRSHVMLSLDSLFPPNA